MYDKLDVVAHDYNLSCGEVMLGRLLEFANQPVYLTAKVVVCLPHACTQICVNITTHMCIHTHMHTQRYGKLSEHLREANTESWLREYLILSPVADDKL